MNLLEELQVARDGLAWMVANGHATQAQRQSDYLRDLNNLEMITRYMAQTRVALDARRLHTVPSIYAGEIQNHIQTLRANGQTRIAEERSIRLAFFCLFPTYDNLRRIFL